MSVVAPPSPQYHRAVRFLTTTYGPAFRAAGDDAMRLAAAVAFAVNHVYRKFPKLTSEEVRRGVFEAAKHSLGSESVPHADTLGMLITGLGLTREIMNTGCCRDRCPGLCKAKPETTDEAGPAAVMIVTSSV
jgi:hypothetical protein